MEESRPTTVTDADALTDESGGVFDASNSSVLEKLVKAPERSSPTRSFDILALEDEGDYKGFYGLYQNPFSDAVNPEFFYKTVAHDEALIRMKIAVRNDISLGLVTGTSGTGKTLISQMLLREVSGQHFQPVVVLVSPGMSKTALLREILTELGLDAPGGSFARAQELLHILHQRIMELYECGRKLVLLIDECHFLSADTLHLLRTLSNIEVPEHKLATCLLFAEERFLRRLAHPSYESLRNRIYMHSQLEPLNDYDTEQYLNFRLMKAGRIDPLFDKSAAAAIHQLSGGTCRRINKIALLSLIEGTMTRSATITADLVSSFDVML